MAFTSLGGVFGDIADTYNSWINARHPFVRAIWESSKILDRLNAQQLMATYISLGIGTLSIIFVILAPLSAVIKPQARRNRSSKSGPWQAGWMKPSDTSYLASNKTGLPLAIYKGKLLRYQKNDKKGWRGGHHLVVSGTRGGKGISAVIPAIIDHQGPVAVLDIKGENFAVTRRYRESLGRTVAVLNPFGLIEKPNDQFNPLDYIRPNELSRDVDLIADGLVKIEGGDGEHFSNLARQLVAAAIEVVVTQAEPEERNLISVADILLDANLDDTLQTWVDEKDIVGTRPAQIAATILRAGDRERGSIQTTVAKAFEWMQSDQMHRFLTKSTFELDDMLDDKLDLFIVVPLDQIGKQAVFMRLFINLVLGTVIRQDGRRKVAAPILLVLDEFVRMGRMEQIMNVANVAAGAGIEALFVTQDTGQVESAYGRNDARSIFGSCITKRIFNLNDIQDAEWAVRHLGENTIYSQQIREGKTLFEQNDFSYSEQRQNLMSASQIREMGSNDVLLLIGNKSPLKAKLNVYFDNKKYQGKYDDNPLV